MESCHSRHGYLAGADEIRLNDLHMAFADKNVKGIFAARGGYGAGRLLPYLDYDLIRKNPKIFVGYSDVTALHLAINQQCGFVTFHGPMPAADFSRGVLAFTLDSFKNMIFGSPKGLIKNPANTPLKTIVPGWAKGPLTGGNLCLLAASLGTPFELDASGRILFIEEIAEEPYRIDRMLLQLHQAGKLRAAAGIILGSFAPETLETLEMCINEIIKKAGKPTIAGLACGHTSPNITLPLGRVVELDAGSGTIKLLNQTF